MASLITTMLTPCSIASSRNMLLCIHDIA
jgi:hypothetical protein